MKLSGNTFLAAGDGGDMPQVFVLLQENGIATDANPDLYVREYRQFGVDDAQELRMRASSRGIAGRRAFVISASSMTTEAQNALLKTLEEPPDDALFIFIIPAPETLLATVRSRSQILKLKPTQGGGSASMIQPSAFFAATPAQRIDMLKVVLEKDADDKYDTAAILAFLASLETYAEMVDLRNPTHQSVRKEALDTIYRARMYITDRGALVKTLLESVALLSPQIAANVVQ